MNDSGRGVAVGLGFCAVVALVCSMEDDSGALLALKGLTLVWLAVMSMLLIGAMMPKKDKKTL